MSKNLLEGIAFAAVILLAVLGLRYAARNGLIGLEEARQFTQVALGLALAAYANAMPKRIGRAGSLKAAAHAQAVLRFGGWAMTLGALAYAGLWAFTPTTFADAASLVALGGATAATLVYAAGTFAACRVGRSAATEA